MQSPAQGTVEDSGVPIFKELQPNVPNWGACQNHMGSFFQRPLSRAESGSQIETRSVGYGEAQRVVFIYVLGCEALGQCKRQACVPLTKKQGQVYPMPQREMSNVL